MIDPYWLSALTILVLVICSLRYKQLVILVFIAFLICLSLVSGYPTNAPLPDKIVVWAITPDYVWAAEMDKPLLPRAYKFHAPLQWAEAMDQNEGKPIVAKKKGKADQETQEGQTQEGEFYLEPFNQLPEKGSQ